VVFSYSMIVNIQTWTGKRKKAMKEKRKMDDREI
jgi:hypothetical protein